MGETGGGTVTELSVAFGRRSPDLDVKRACRLQRLRIRSGPPYARDVVTFTFASPRRAEKVNWDRRMTMRYT